MRLVAITIAAATACLAGALPAAAAPGDLDPSFSEDGRRTFDLYKFDLSYEALPQDDGKIVLVGHTSRDGEDSDVALMRFRPGGRLDESFAGDGVKTRDWGEFELAYGAATQDDGKIVVVGSSDEDFRSADNDFLVARYLPGGNLDKSFSGDGMRTTHFGADETALGVAVGDDGSIVAAGDTTRFRGDVAKFAVARYESDGSLDESFSGDGKVTTKFGQSPDDDANGVALHDDGSVVVAGSSGFEDFAVARYDSSGDLDGSFSDNGKATTDFDDGLDRASGVAIQDDGKIVLGGDADDELALARYEPDGDLDMTFSGDGRQTTSFTEDVDNEFGGLVLDSDERIVIAGHSFGGKAAVARFEPDGGPDAAFGPNGQRERAVGRSYFAAATAVQADGRILLGGTVRGDTNRQGDLDYLLARLLG